MISRLALAAALFAAPALAQSPPPQPVPMPAATIAPVDTPYPGTIAVHVDATDLDRRILTVHETIPVAQAGPMTLLYPEWLPGKHSPRGPVDKLAGLIIHAGATRLEWTRDPVDVYAFHIDVPAGSKTIDLDFQFVSPTDPKQGRVVMTPNMLNLEFDQTTLYPAGYFTRQIPVSATVKFPDGWKVATALRPVGGAPAGETRFNTVPFETLVDSPIFAGRYMRVIPLDTSSRPVTLSVVADRPDLLAATPEQIAPHVKLVKEAVALFGSKHFDHYDLLLALSDKQGGIGLEHHRSSENGSVPAYFTEWDKNPNARGLLPHELSHSWDGKFRRGADSWTPNFNVPMRNSLLWVYEGGTQYFGTILGGRSGMWSKQQTLDVLAADAATYDAVVGRTWKPLIDTTNDPITAERSPEPWRNWQRSEDYYTEGLLIWLDADTLIRERSGGKRSLDDFAHRFFGVDDGSWTELSYTFDDVVAALNATEPFDWAKFLHDRLTGHGPGAPLDGITRGGYKVVYTDTPSDFAKTADATAKRIDLNYSLGLSVDKDGALTTVMWGGPAFKAGLTVGTVILSVDGDAYDGDVLKRAVAAAKTGAPVELIVKTADRFRTVKIDWNGGLRYPHLERTGTGPAQLDAIIASRTK
jgi:predicted metalloprotease with PDZ domain